MAESRGNEFSILDPSATTLGSRLYQQMTSLKYNGCHTPLKEIFNTTKGSGPTTSNLQPNECKERVRKYASRPKGKVTKNVEKIILHVDFLWNLNGYSNLDKPCID